MTEINFVPKARHLTHKFTDDQNEAIEKIVNWYSDDKSLIFTLSGAAGTGKTYVLNYILNTLIKKNSCVTAPTHKAVRVVERATGKKGKTIHSLHGLRPNISLENFDLDNIKFDPLGKEYMAEFALVVIDECSQVNSDLHKLNLIKSNQYKTKILYVGDEFQLAPVKEDHSLTFDVENKAKLNQIVRQQDSNPLLELLELAKYDITNDSSTLAKFLNTTKKKAVINHLGEGYLILDNHDFQCATLELFKSQKFYENVEYVRYGAWTNNNITIWNNYIRKSIITDNSKLITKHDLLVGYRSIVNEFGTISIINSGDYFVDTITERLSDGGFKVFVVSLKSFDTGLSTIVNIVDHTCKSFVRFKNHLTQLYLRARYSKGYDRNKYWKQYFTFKDRHLGMINIPIRDSERVLLDVKKDLDYGYGLTIHKLQGSTFENILVNMRDIYYYGGDKSNPVKNSNFDRKAIETRNKLAYTALSRASKRAILLW
jgi:hypothetical protein